MNRDAAGSLLSLGRASSGQGGGVSSGGGGGGAGSAPYSSNTGPKGVLSDSRQAGAEARDARAAAVQRTRAEQERGALTALSVREEEALRIREGERAARPSSELYPRQQGADEVFDVDLSRLDLRRLDLSALDLSDDELALLLQLRDEQQAAEAAERDELGEWRDARRAQLQQGDVREIDTDEFLDVVEDRAAVLIYEEAAGVLRRHPAAPPIVKITATALQFMTTPDGPDDAVLPAVLVYRRGDLVGKHIRFEGDLEALLKAERFLTAPLRGDVRDDD